MIVCIDCFKLFQTISNKNKTCNGPGSQSESEKRTWHHALTSKKNKVFYILIERIINKFNTVLFFSIIYSIDCIGHMNCTKSFQIGTALLLFLQIKDSKLWKLYWQNFINDISVSATHPDLYFWSKTVWKPWSCPINYAGWHRKAKLILHYWFQRHSIKYWTFTA